MDLRKVKKLIELLEESNLSEMEIREGEESIRLSRGSSVSVPAVMPQPQMAAPIVPTTVSPEPIQEKSDSADVPEGHRIHSPMVGSYYGSSKPESPPFVSVGSKVKAGDTLCLIEAMKIFNQIEADKSGTVVAILKENGDAVEYGELLFVIQ